MEALENGPIGGGSPQQVAVTPASASLGDGPSAGIAKRAPRQMDLRSNGYHPPSIGPAILLAHGIPLDDRKLLTTLNFAADHTVGVLPGPIGDLYLAWMGVAVASEHEIPVVLRMQAGLLDYYRKIGVLKPEQKVIEVDPIVNDRRILGHPTADAMHCLHSGQRNGHLIEGSRLVSAFPTHSLRTISRSLGLEMPQSYDPGVANDKALFREGLKKRGVTVLPGSHIETLNEIPQAVEALRGARKAWFKVSGSGGDLVLPIEGPINEDKILKAVMRLRGEVQTAFEVNHYPVSFEDYWPSNRLAPAGTRLVVEQDVEDMGERLLNASIALMVDKDGNYGDFQVFRQFTDPVTGAFCGGAPINTLTDNLPIVRELFEEKRGGGVRRLYEQLPGAIEFAMNEANFCGMLGFDFWFVEDRQTKEVHPYFCEMNPRPIMNQIAWTVASKFNPKACANANIWAPFPLETTADLEKALGPELFYGNINSGLAFPIAMRTVQRMKDGKLEVVHSSNACKLLIMADSMDIIDETLTKLKGRGISLSPIDVQ